MKIFRLQVIVKAGWCYIKQLGQPNGVFVVRYNGQLLEDEVANSVIAFVMIFLMSFAVVAVALSLMGLDTLTALSAGQPPLPMSAPALGQ